MIGVFLKAYAIKKLSNFFFFSLVVYISNYFIIHEMIQIRSGIASALILLSIIPLYKKLIFKFTFLIGLATFFHYSSFIFFLLIFLRSNTFNRAYYLLLIPASYFFNKLFAVADLIGIISNYIPFLGIIDKLDIYGESDLYKINVFGLYPITRIIILIYFIFFAHKIQKYNKYNYLLLKMYALGIFAYIALSIYPIISVRVAYTLLLSEVIIIPTLIYSIKGFYLPRFSIILYSFLAFFLNVFFTSYFVSS